MNLSIKNLTKMNPSIEELKEIMFRDGTRCGANDMRFIKDCIKRSDLGGEKQCSLAIVWKERSCPHYFVVNGKFDRYGNPLK